MEELVYEYARRLQEIYENRTAGDYTFEGILYEFSLKVAGKIKQDKISPPMTVPYS